MPESTKKQNYGNHIRFYPAHHFLFLPLALLLTLASAYVTYRFEDRRLGWAAITLAFFLISFLAVMLRQHYALGNQNRIVRLEMRLRYYQLTGKRLEEIEEQLGFGRIAALRFAPDEELPELTRQALAEKLSPDEIKKRVKNWKADHMRL